MKSTTRFFNLFVAVSLVLAAIGFPLTAQAAAVTQPSATGTTTPLGQNLSGFRPIIKEVCSP